jgi:HAD superfamily hydrolase (TIGR01549 family)
MMIQNVELVPAVVKRKMSEFSPSISESNLSSEIFQPAVVIFDKDGTLVCFHTMWNSWCEDLASRMTAETAKDLSSDVYELMGYDYETKKIGMGMLAEKTHPYIKEKVAEMLVKQGFHELEAKKVLDKTWKDTPENMQIKMTGNLRDLFSRLRERKIKIAICTSDSREGTVEFLEKLHLKEFVDIVVCGDDKISKSKPDPHNAIYICNELNVKRSEAIMVGDTPADTIMGQAANLGLTIGVLTGVGAPRDLTHADLIVPSVSEVVDLVTNEDTEDFYSVSVTSRGLSKIAGRSSAFVNSKQLHV